MAQFPALTPDERDYTLGAKPQVEFRGEGNVPVLFQTGNLAVGHQLTLPFTNRPLAEVEQIWDHFNAQQRDLFTLPAAVWCGHTGGSTVVDASLQFRYLDAAAPERVAAGVYSITVTLEAVGVSIGATGAASALADSEPGTIEAEALDALPARPEPVPDPTPEAPTITDTPPTTGQLPAGEVLAGANVELRFSTHGFADTGEVEVGASVELLFSTGGIPATGEVLVGENVDLLEEA